MRTILLAVLITTIVCADPPKPGMNPQRSVAKATTIDWTFAVASQSVVAPPPAWLGDYDSTKTAYDLFLPTVKDGKQPLGLIVYIAADNNAGGSGPIIEACKGLGLACAAVREAGNNTPPRRRVRMAMDVLDDVRSLVPIDGDRTYIAGFSGGARMACAIGFALPEVFGGILSIGAADEMREEPYLRQRCVERTSVAFVVGEKDFNRAEAERYKGPILKDVGVRSLVKVVPGGGHGVPDAKVLTEAIGFLEAGAKQRRDLAKEYPASRLTGNPTRAELAQALLDEGKKRLANPKTLYSGLMQVKGALDRWPDLKTAKPAQDLLESYETKKDGWAEQDIAEQRRYLVAKARGVTAYATGELPKQYEGERSAMLRGAVELWEGVLADGKDVKAVEEGKKRLPELKRLLEK